MKDIIFQGRLYQGCERDIPTGRALDWKMEQWHTYLTKLTSYPVLNAPVDWIDGKEVTGLYRLEKRDAVINVLNRKNPFVMWAAPASEIPNDLDWSYHQINAIDVAVPASSGEKEEQEVKEDEKLESERKRLMELQSDHSRWFSKEEFERLQEISKILFSTNKQVN